MGSPQPIDDEERTWAGGAQPSRERRPQDNSGSGRGVGLGLTTMIGALLIAGPLIWAVYYLLQAGAAGLGGGFVVLVAIVLVACVGAGVLLLRGLFKT